MPRLISRLAARAVLAATLAAPCAVLADSSPAITEARVDGAVLRIVGFNLGGGTPKVTLGTLPLAVVAITANELQALVPASVLPGSYLLSVDLGNGRSGANEGKFDEFWVTLGATGAAGPVGPQGPAGPQGMQGVAGPAGPAGAVASLDALAGLPCNVANTRNACRGTAAVNFDAATNAVALACEPLSPDRPLLMLWSNTGDLVHGQSLVVTSTVPGLAISDDHDERRAFSMPTCPGETVSVTFRLTQWGGTPPYSSLQVTAGSCVGHLLMPGSSVICTVVMDGNQDIFVN